MHKGLCQPRQNRAPESVLLTQTPEDVFRVMLELSQDVGHRLRVHELMACGVQVSVRDKLTCMAHSTSVSSHSRTQLPNRNRRSRLSSSYGAVSRWDKPIRAVTIRGNDLVSQREAKSNSLCSWIIRNGIAISFWRTLSRTSEGRFWETRHFLCHSYGRLKDPRRRQAVGDSCPDLCINNDCRRKGETV